MLSWLNMRLSPGCPDLPESAQARTEDGTGLIVSKQEATKENSCG